MNLQDLTPTHVFTYRGFVFSEYIIDIGHPLAVKMLEAQQMRQFALRRPIYRPHPTQRIKIIWTKHFTKDELAMMEATNQPVPMFHTDCNPDERQSMIDARHKLMKMIGDHYQLPGHGLSPTINPTNS